MASLYLLPSKKPYAGTLLLETGPKQVKDFFDNGTPAPPHWQCCGIFSVHSLPPNIWNAAHCTYTAHPSPTSPFPIFCGNRPDTFSTYVHLHENPEHSRSLLDECAVRSAPLHWQCCILNTSYSIRRGAHFLKLWPNSTERIKFHYSRVRKRVKLDTIVFILG